MSVGLVPTILQLTDLHLFADKGALLKGINPWQSLERVLSFARSSGIQFDHVVLTGDLTHDGQGQTYEHLREALGDWADRDWMIPGNHDDRRHVGQVFNLSRHSTALLSLPDRVTFSFSAGHWRVIGLDTLVPGELFGQVGGQQLSWLEGELKRYPAAATLIFMHHPPVDVGSAWLDKIGLRDREGFCSLVASSPQVKLVCCGHIHQEFTARLGAATVLAAPSTSVQFQPGTEALVVDELPPGFRILELHEDGYETDVVRLAD